MKKPSVVLIIRDGWGIAPPGKYNAISQAKTPNMDYYLANFPVSVLKASGTAVGLPDGYMGSSEVGHLNIGAGRIVEQELKKIKDLIANGDIFRAPAVKAVFENCVKNNSALHLMGLAQDEGVHAHQDHFFAFIDRAIKEGIRKIYIHFFADGRDTPPNSAPQYIKIMEEAISKTHGIAEIATIIGRYYAMDRSEKWNLVDTAYNAIVLGEGTKSNNAFETVAELYKTKNPDGTPLTDEYIAPIILNNYEGVKDGDGVIHLNFRQDRAIELTKAFTEQIYPGKRKFLPKITYCGLTRYYDSFKNYALPPMDEGDDMKNLLGQVLADNGLTQLRLSETQKFKHVTSFFNGKLLKPYKGEDRIEIKGTIDPAKFAEYPEMNALDVAHQACRQISAGKHDFILINFANCDMVGHTGIFPSVVKAAETVDACVGKVADCALKQNAVVLITSDHGNAECMYDEERGTPKTAHTLNDVHFILVSSETRKYKLRPSGILADIAPTVLAIMGLCAPCEMTGENLWLTGTSK